MTWAVGASAFAAEIVDGCELGRELRADATVEGPVAGVQALQLTAAAADPGWGACDEPGDDAPVVTIVAIGLPRRASAAPGSGSGDGSSVEPGATDGSTGGEGSDQTATTAVTGEWARVTQTRADGATWTSGDVELVDGMAEIRVQAWGTAAETSTLVVEVQGPYLRSGTEDGCSYDVVLAGEATVEAALGSDPPAPIEVALAETRLETGCAGSTELPRWTPAARPTTGRAAMSGR